MTLPDGDRRIFGLDGWQGGDFATICYDDLAFMKSDDGDGVAQGEFVERFDNLHDGHREQEDFGIKDGAKKFLNLDGGAQDDEIWIHEETVGIAACDEIDGITGNESELGGTGAGVEDDFGGDGIFGKVADEKVGVGGIHGVGERFGVAKRAGGGGRQISDIIHRREFGLEGVGEDGFDVFEMGVLGSKFGNFDGSIKGLAVAANNI